MTDDARRALLEEERARIQAARRHGGMCALCGRALERGEPVWIQRLLVRGQYGGRAARWTVPVGRECAAPDTLHAGDRRGPASCATCGRPVFGDPAATRRRVVACSARCRRKHTEAQIKEGHRS